MSTWCPKVRPIRLRRMARKWYNGVSWTVRCKRPLRQAPWWPFPKPDSRRRKAMARRGRKPTGSNLVEHLEGSERAKARLKAILETLSGARSIPEVCEELGINESMFHRVRSEVLQTALQRLEPRPLGRPPQQPPPEELRVAEMEEENL